MEVSPLLTCFIQYFCFSYPTEPISLLHGRSTGSLDEITFADDTELHRELDNFFGSEAEVS